MKSPIPCRPLILAAIAVFLIAACEDTPKTARAPTKSELALETDFELARQRLEQSRTALGVTQRRLSALQGEQADAQRRIAELTARAGGLERQVRDMGQHLARAQAQLAQSQSIQQALRQQRDQYARRVHELGNEKQAMGARLAGAYDEIRRIQAGQGPSQRHISELHQRGTAAAREIDELRRYNGYLLQERSNLQAWLQEANAVGSARQEALEKAAEEADRIKDEAAASEQKLRARLDAANRQLAQLTASRDALAAETGSLRAHLSQAAEVESKQGAQLEKALAHAASLADANARMASELQSSRKAADPPGAQGKPSGGDADSLRAELHRATDKLVKLKAANDYLLEKIEACTLQQRSSRSAAPRRAEDLALPSGAPPDRRATGGLRHTSARFTTGHGRIGASVAMQLRPRLIAVAEPSNEEPGSGRREKELNAARNKALELEKQQAALEKKIEALEAENATVKKQVQTLTWANEVLVKELDAAYAGKNTANPDSLPKGTRGIYVLRKGESLSRVANAFYGDPRRWKDIVKANQEKIPDPDRVKAGTVILIPE